MNTSESSPGESGALRSDGQRLSISQILAADIPASLVVFLVAVPLALGIAVASGAPVAAGLLGCIIGGVITGALAGAPLQVSGPAAGLTILILGLTQKYDWQTVCLITILAGALQIVFGSLKIARISLMISPAVVHGMLAGIGVTIALGQMHVLLGDRAQSSALKNLVALPTEIGNLFSKPTSMETHAALVGLATVLILVAWLYVPKSWRKIPGALMAVGIGTLLGNLVFPDAPRVMIPEGALFKPGIAPFPADLAGLAIAAVTIALVASVESLLCAVATDKLQTGKRANLDRELIAQGVGNMVSGFVGGLPITGVIVRSATNVTAGAKTRFSAIFHGLWVLAFVLLATAQLNKIPLATLAGLLVFVGARLVNPRDIRELHVHREFRIYLVTLLGVAFWNLLAGVGLGIGLAVFLLLRRLAFTKAIVEKRAESSPDGLVTERWHVALEGSLTFLSVPQLTNALAQVPPGTAVDVDLKAEFMDHAAFEALHGWRHAHEKTGGHVDIDERHESWYTQAADGAPRVSRSKKAPQTASSTSS